MALQPADVTKLRLMKANGTLNVKKASEFYGLSVETIRRAVRGDTYANLQQPKSDEEAVAEAKEAEERLRKQLEEEAAHRAAKAEGMLEELAPKEVRDKAAEWLGRKPQNPLEE